MMASVYSLRRIDSRGVRSRDCPYQHLQFSWLCRRTHLHQVQYKNGCSVTLEEVIKVKSGSTIEGVHEVHYQLLVTSDSKESTAYTQYLALVSPQYFPESSTKECCHDAARMKYNLG